MIGNIHCFTERLSGFITVDLTVKLTVNFMAANERYPFAEIATLSVTI
jgi:hypothetical protein